MNFSACIFLLLITGAVSVEWNNLKVKFGINPFSAFFAMPRTESDAISKGWKLNTGCAAEHGFLGRRYVAENGDRSIMLIFDVQGTIAGIQTSIPKSSGYPSEAQKKVYNVFLETATEHVLTAYFVDPATICTTGRSASTLDSMGTGDRLLVQNGTPLSTSNVPTMEIPMTESDLPKKTKWTKGKCFVGMGQHYWYNFRMDMNCDELLPMFLLYNSGKLDGFGFIMLANFQGKYYEHPTLSVADKFFAFRPTCMKEPTFPKTFTSVHIYMYNYPWTKLCLF